MHAALLPAQDLNAPRAHSVLEFVDRDRGDEELRRRDLLGPRGNPEVRLAASHLAEFRHDVRVEDEHHSNAAGHATSVVFGATNSMSATPAGSASRSSARWGPTSRATRYHIARNVARQPASGLGRAGVVSNAGPQPDASDRAVGRSALDIQLRLAIGAPTRTTTIFVPTRKRPGSWRTGWPRRLIVLT